MGIFDRLFGKKDSEQPQSAQPAKPPEPEVAPPVAPHNETVPIRPDPPPVETVPESLVGLKLKNRYVVEAELGRGGIGVVYKAIDCDVHDRPVVIKALLKKEREDQWLTQKFHHESEALSRIDDPGVVKVLDTGQLPGNKPFFVMEFINGVTLRKQLKAEGMDLREVAPIVRQLGQALSAAHSEGVFHRDLKPENIMLQTLKNGAEQAKLIDFGIAKVMDPKAAASTQGFTTAGTWRYMAPEQLDKGETTAATDIFSFGVVVYEMVTGTSPFVTQAKTPISIINELAKLQRVGVRDKLRIARPDLPKEAQVLLLKALAFNAEDRPATAKEFGDKFSLALRKWEQIANDPTVAPRLERVDTQETGAPSGILEETGSILQTPPSDATLLWLEPVGGAVALDSQFYLERSTDAKFHDAINRHDSIILIKGARQMGKTSLLARGIHKARKSGTNVVITDFQELSADCFQSPEAFFLTIAGLMCDQFDLDVVPQDVWQPKRGASVNFKRFLQREVLEKLSAPLVWGMDEADRLFTSDFYSEVFGLFRSWHNARALDPNAPWSRLTMVIAYATEAHLFITDPNQSPFNVGTRIGLEDFTLDQVGDLNLRYGGPLHNADALQRFFNLVGGHPYLVCRGLHEMVSNKLNIGEFEALAPQDEGPLGDHLGRVLHLVTKDQSVCDTVRKILAGQTCQTQEHFYRLRSSGVMAGKTLSEMHPRCQLYATYLKRQLL